MSTRRCACGARLSWPTATGCDSCKLRGRWERLYRAEDDRQRREVEMRAQAAGEEDLDRLTAWLNRKAPVGHAPLTGGARQ